MLDLKKSSILVSASLRGTGSLSEEIIIKIIKPKSYSPQCSVSAHFLESSWGWVEKEDPSTHTQTPTQVKEKLAIIDI